jgi:hypothetical protein
LGPLLGVPRRLCERYAGAYLVGVGFSVPLNRYSGAYLWIHDVALIDRGDVRPGSSYLCEVSGVNGLADPLCDASRRTTQILREPASWHRHDGVGIHVIREAQQEELAASGQ